MVSIFNMIAVEEYNVPVYFPNSVCLCKLSVIPLKYRSSKNQTMIGGRKVNFIHIRISLENKTGSSSFNWVKFTDVFFKLPETE